MHDGQCGFEARLDVHFLERSLVHEGVFLDGLDQSGDASGAVVKFRSDAFHFKERGKADQFRSERSAGRSRKSLEMLVGKIRIGKERSELPSLGDAASLKPRLDGILAIGAGEFVVVIRGLQGSANFILALGKQSTVFGPERGVAAGGAEALEALVERGCGAPGGRGRIVQFVGQTGGQFAQRGPFFAVLLVARDVANAIGQQSHQAPGKLDRKSTRLNSSHGYISYAVFCLKKKKYMTTYAFSLM